MISIWRAVTGAALVGSAFAVAPVPAAGQITDDISIHGHFTQAIGASNDRPVAGLPVGMTTDLRSLAVQLRYRTSPAGEAILQFSHRRLGGSALAAIEPELEVDWAFYRHRFSNLSVRAGRFPAPFGLYSDIRDVGTLLPFYRPAHTFYLDGSETIDGVALNYEVGISDWSLDLDVYGGGSSYRAAFHTPQGPFTFALYTEKVLGGRAQLASPLNNVELGASYMTFPVPGVDGLWSLTGASLRTRHGRFMLEAEGAKIDFDTAILQGGYVRGGVDLTGSLKLLGQYEFMEQEYTFPFAMEGDLWEERVLGLNYRASPEVVFKLESHWARGYAFDEFIPFPGPAGRTRYGLASVSVSF